MLKGLIGKKIGMTQIFDDQGVAYPVTLIEAGPCYVTQVRTPEKEGYSAVQLGFSEVHPKRLTNGQLGHLTANKIPPLRFLREFRSKSPEVNVGDKVTVEVFAIGEHVDVIGVSKGKGFAGVVKRHHFHGMDATHGTSDRNRAPGSNSSGTTPGRVYRGVRLGKLADLFLINTRTHRDPPAPPPEMHDPNRTELGLPQRKWLFDELDRSSATWRIIGNPSVLGTTWRKDLPDSARLPLLKTKLIAADGLGPDYDQWDGYPAERYLLMRKIRDHKLGNTVVLSGDIHIGLAQELKMDPFDPAQKAIAIECVNTSITSPNFDDEMKWEPRAKSLQYEQELLSFFPEMKYINLDSHGYNVVDITAERVQVEWWYVDTVKQRTDQEWCGAAFRIESGRPALIPVQ